MTIPQYTQQANAQSLAAQQTLASQQKQASMFNLKGGADIYQSPNMGGNNEQTQQLANKVAGAMAVQQSQAYQDQRYKGGRMKRKRTIKKYNRRKTTKKFKRNTKRKYTKRW
jgi:hypothetical protein